ncbi:hypothetical protein GIB67_007243 [Kingdonia uniflora]|uniref:Protein FAR1-RELATED SEQUENCE n=1 Tax=Kingdonia uniflora TaxID=39325 RepID=A0A7J7NXL4_9MAGN|nr:hypothetical protein GIB67_007243 [Kingdonia uniflora]
MEESESQEKDVLLESYGNLEDNGEECCVEEDVELPVVLNDAKEDCPNGELCMSLIGGVVEPVMGMEFDSEDDARNFYNAYAKQMGFSTRVNSYYRSKKDNSIISREFCCSKEGFRRERRPAKVDSSDMKKRRARPITWEGCRAFMTVRRRDCGKWFVAKLDTSHNHELVTSAMRHFLRSHRPECDDQNKCLFDTIGSSGSGASSTINILSEECDGFNKMRFIDQDQRMFATQRSGSVNSLFDGYVNARTTLQIFADQYEKALDDRFEKEVRAEFDTAYTKPVLKTPLPIEKQAADIYTRKMFKVFQEEIFESLVLAVEKREEDVGTTSYGVARFDEELKVYSVECSVREKVASCNCKMFESEGILCRHVLAVFKVANIFLLPSHYILKRWTRDAKEEIHLDTDPSIETQANFKRAKNSQYNILYQEAIKCVKEGVASDHSFKVAFSALREARRQIVDAKKSLSNRTKLEGPVSASYQGGNDTIVSEINSSTVPLAPCDPQRCKTVLGQHTSGDTTCRICNC